MNNLSLLLAYKLTNKNPAILNYQLIFTGIEKAMWQENFYQSVKNSVGSKKKKGPSLVALYIDKFRDSGNQSFL